MSPKKKARLTIELPKRAANDSVDMYWKMVDLRDQQIEKRIFEFTRDNERGHDESGRLRSKSMVGLSVFRWIESSFMCLYGSEVVKLKPLFQSSEYRRAMLSFDAFEEFGATLGDPVLHMRAFKAALYSDVHDFEVNNVNEAQYKAKSVREALGGLNLVPDNGIDSEKKKELDAALEGNIKVLTIEIDKLNELKRKLYDARNMLPRLEYLRPVLEEFKS
jgi:hypothetical protein